MPTAVAHVAIATPARYMNRLAKHFEHRVGVQRAENTASIAFPDAPCSLVASDTHLDLRLDAASTETLARLQDVVTRHLRQVASQESFDVHWTVSD
jgi:hypothetical protein